MTQAAPARDVISFGPFRLTPKERLLTKEGAPVELGARALDILIALVSRSAEVVSKRDLLAWVWPGVTVDEAAVRVHIAGLRKALGDGQDGARYIATVPGRGYSFVAPISRSDDRRSGHPPTTTSFPHANLPSRLTRMVGRDDDVLGVSARLIATRFVTIVGPGGVGKTTVAVAVAHRMSEVFGGAVLFVDLGMLSDPGLVATAVASMFGLSVQSDDATPGLIAYLRDRRILLLLDTCEHLIEAVAGLASRIVTDAAQIHILATSREPMQIEGEHVYKLDALAWPPEGPEITTAMVQTFPAAQLFVDRAVASGVRLELNDAEVALVAGICRKLEGVALAIELAAGRVQAYGLQQTAVLLDQRLTLLWPGKRTAPPRQKTLQATLDWSYGLLSELERMVLRRLAIFVGHFTLDAALAVVTSATLDQSLVFGAIDSLVAKSMVAARPVGAMMHFRLLDTTRAYVLDIRLDGSELADLATRHAAYYRRWLEQNGTEWAIRSIGVDQAPHFTGINNVRAALEWCFGCSGNAEIGVGLAATAGPAFLATSLLPECYRWSERAIRALDDTTRGGSEEMHLQAGLGVSSMHIDGPNEAALLALNRSLAIAETRRDVLNQVGLLGTLSMFHTRDGDFKTALHYAKLSRAVDGIVENSAAMALANSTFGRSLQFVGDHSGSRIELEASFRYWSRSHESTEPYLGLDHHILVGIGLARNLWLQGQPAQAKERVTQTIKDAERKNHPASLGLALSWAPSIFLWIGDLRSADEHADWLISHAESHSLGPYLAVARGYKGALATSRGDARSGVADLQVCLEQLHAMRYGMLNTAFKLSLVESFLAIGRFPESLTLIDETIRMIEANCDLLHMPEALRVKGRILLSMPQLRAGDAEMCFMQSLDWSRRQGARSWELRTGVDLAALWAAQGQRERAQAVLQPIFEEFMEGFDTADLKAAEHLLATLR